MFDTLGEFQKRRNLSWYMGQQTRVTGFLAERMSHAFFRILQTEQPGLRIKQLPIVIALDQPDGTLRFTANARQPFYEKPVGKETLAVAAIVAPSTPEIVM